MNPPDSRAQKIRWRLVLGADAEQCLGGLAGTDAERDSALAYLYDREAAGGSGSGKGADRRGSLDASSLTVPAWINAVHELFPQRTIERIERDALERYQLSEMVTNLDLLQRAAPSLTLLKAVLHTKHLMNAAVLAAAREMARRVVEELMKQLAQTVHSPFLGVLHRQRPSSLRVARNFDAPRTIRRNLQHFDPVSSRLFIRTPHFSSRVRRHSEKWQIIILVDESGSMAGSVIHSAVTAAIFFGIKTLRTHLVLFDTALVDVSADCADPVETIMKVQLGGGTDIGQAVRYAETLIENPRRAIVVLISDFCEGAPVQLLYDACGRLVAQGTHLLGLAALDANATPNYDHTIAARLVALGAHVGAMTPGELAQWVAEKVT